MRRAPEVACGLTAGLRGAVALGAGHAPIQSRSTPGANGRLAMPSSVDSVDIRISYPCDLASQMLEFSRAQ